LAGASDYTHTISVDGGYRSMSFTVAASQSEINDWINSGLARHIIVLDDSGSQIWEGFVNEISVDVGATTLTLGPLIDMANRIYVMYTRKSWTIYGVTIGGGEAITAAANDTDSQGKYGIMEEYVSGGTGSSTEMEALRDVHLLDRSSPHIVQATVSTGGGSDRTMTISCVGYYEIFNKYIYASTSTGESAISDKIQDVVNADPSTRFSSDYSLVATNSLSVPDLEAERKTASTVLSELVSYGDASGNRYTLGVYNDRKLKYSQIESSPYYTFNVTENPGGIYNIDGARIEPWNVVPGKWLVLTSISADLGDLSSIDALRSNPNALYIEEVTFSAPYSVSLTSGPTSTFKQRIARLGLELAQ